MIKIGLSPQGQYLWSISECNILSIWDTEKQRKKYKGERIEFEKKDFGVFFGQMIHIQWKMN